MKKMKCKQLGGACDKEFQAETFSEIAKLSKEHGMEMVEKKDPEHLEAMAKMREKMQNPEDMQKWFEEVQKEFDALPEA